MRESRWHRGYVKYSSLAESVFLSGAIFVFGGLYVYFIQTMAEL